MKMYVDEYYPFFFVNDIRIKKKTKDTCIYVQYP